MEVETLRQVLSGLSDALNVAQHKIQEVHTVLSETDWTALSQSKINSPSTSTSSNLSHSHHLEARVLELEDHVQLITAEHEDLLHMYRLRENELENAVMARENSMRMYRHLVKVSVDLLQALTQRFPPEEELDEPTYNAILDDLRGAIDSPQPSSSSDTVRPPAGNPEGTDMDQDGAEGSMQSTSHVGLSGNTVTDNTPRTGTHLSAFSPIPIPQNGSTLSVFRIHSGSRCPSSIKTTTGPLTEAEFLRLGFEGETVDDIFQSLTLPRDISCRLAPVPAPAGFGNINMVFLYDPIYLETGISTYILIWDKAEANESTIKWLRKSAHTGVPVFHTFTYPIKKKRWYYHGAVSWKAVPPHELPFQNVWSTLSAESRVKILKQLSERSHKYIQPEEIEYQLDSGELEELCIEIATVDDRWSTKTIASRLGKSPKTMEQRATVSAQ